MSIHPIRTMTLVHRDVSTNAVTWHVSNNRAISRTATSPAFDNMFEANNRPFGTFASPY